ncbi:hypothetical protein [Micromonospora sp. HM5-17]|uniref:hypothetical protein n=1 Tax=Micromonospora sp. HM5-17 TaxID=2487710 RepID=UPI0011CE732C|nr:hypothetical protein [Micromonospora sp. HM5-17]
MALRQIVKHGVLALSAAILVVPGCTINSPDPIPTDRPGVDNRDRISTPSPTPSSRWQGLNAECPTIDEKLPGLPGIVGPGVANDDYSDNRRRLIASCNWKGSGTLEPLLISSVTVYRMSASTTVEELAADAFDLARQDARNLARSASDWHTPPEDLTGLGDGAFLTIHLAEMAIRLVARSENAKVSITILLKAPVQPDLARRLELLRAQRSNIVAAAEDILDDLR